MYDLNFWENIGLVIFSLVVVSYLLPSIIKYKKNKRSETLEKWAIDKGLNFLKEERLNKKIKDIVWGEYKGEKVYMFNFDGMELRWNWDLIDGIDKRSINIINSFFNNNFYSLIKASEIDKIISNPDFKNKKVGLFGYQRKGEIEEILIANIYFKSGERFEYSKVTKFLNVLFDKNKVNLSLIKKQLFENKDKIMKDILANSNNIFSKNELDVMVAVFSDLVKNY